MSDEDPPAPRGTLRASCHGTKESGAGWDMRGERRVASTGGAKYKSVGYKAAQWAPPRSGHNAYRKFTPMDSPIPQTGSVYDAAKQHDEPRCVAASLASEEKDSAAISKPLSCTLSASEPIQNPAWSQRCLYCTIPDFGGGPTSNGMSSTDYS